MVSPLQSIAANLRPGPNLALGFGDILSQGRQISSNLESQELQRENVRQQMGQRKQALSAEQSLGAARYINSLGKQLLTVDESMWPQILAPQLSQLAQIGYDPQVLKNMTREQVESAVAQTEPLVKRGNDAPVQIQTRDRLLNDLRSENQDVRQSAAIELGLEGRATGAAPQVVDIGGVPHIFDKQNKKLVPVEIGGQKITSGTISKTKAEIKAAVTEASSNAQRMSKDTATNRSDEKALRVYDTAMDGLTQALSGAETGLAGWLPAVTSDARIAEGAISAMAPVLKSLFRSAGEGSFTDKDQELLLQMVPTRKDDAAARKAKITNIDAIVRAKLSNKEGQLQTKVDDQPQTIFSKSLGREVSESDIQETLQANPGITREDLLIRLGVN